MDAKLIALKLFLAEFGISEKIESVNDRKRLQKAVYVGQLSGIDLGYRFGWYLMGPYSPALTRDYYDLDEAVGEGDKEYESVELKAPIRKSLSRVKSLFSVPQKVRLSQEEWLELVSSIHFLRKVSGYDEEKVHSVLEKQKPRLIVYERDAENALKKAELL